MSEKCGRDCKDFRTLPTNDGWLLTCADNPKSFCTRKCHMCGSPVYIHEGKAGAKCARCIMKVLEDFAEEEE